MCVDAALFKQTFMGSPLGDPIFCDDNDLVRVADGGKTVGNGDSGPVL